ncbi:hypothetical protein [Brucella sp. IR073]|uniref:hypothetical protein n=1 Tax=unclassified Brucella TaxID=2632610 RepID=UPI003B97F6A2
MNHTIFSVTYIGIVAAAGLALGVPDAWRFAAVTAALAFLGGEAWEYYQITGRDIAYRMFVLLTSASWFTGAVAGIFLLV